VWRLDRHTLAKHDAGGWQWRNSDGSIGLLTTVTT
jgi:hypothetical protein